MGGSGVGGTKKSNFGLLGVKQVFLTVILFLPEVNGAKPPRIDSFRYKNTPLLYLKTSVLGAVSA